MDCKLGGTKKVKKGHKKGAPWAFVDVLFILLIFYITQTDWIRQVYDESPSELMLPAMTISESQTLDGEDGHFGSALVIISLAMANGKPVWHFGTEELGFQELGNRLASEVPTEVCLRINEDVPHGQVMRIIDLARVSGISNVSFAYKEKRKVG